MTDGKDKNLCKSVDAKERMKVGLSKAHIPELLKDFFHAKFLLPNS